MKNEDARKRTSEALTEIGAQTPLLNSYDTQLDIMYIGAIYAKVKRDNTDASDLSDDKKKVLDQFPILLGKFWRREITLDDLNKEAETLDPDSEIRKQVTSAQDKFAQEIENRPGQSFSNLSRHEKARFFLPALDYEETTLDHVNVVDWRFNGYPEISLNSWVQRIMTGDRETIISVLRDLTPDSGWNKQMDNIETVVHSCVILAVVHSHALTRNLSCSEDERDLISNLYDNVVKFEFKASSDAGSTAKLVEWYAQADVALFELLNMTFTKQVYMKELMPLVNIALSNTPVIYQNKDDSIGWVMYGFERLVSQFRGREFFIETVRTTLRPEIGEDLKNQINRRKFTHLYA
eukprot:GHVU01227300.1.p1 GENE.GHVU01227300.1~~GHVU01227300.1.p1  ORF type:complete len:350 (+),score=38.15 GHVU01227300.1:2-1051(+)